jgi:hypothetical protein
MSDVRDVFVMAEDGSAGFMGAGSKQSPRDEKFAECD